MEECKCKPAKSYAERIIEYQEFVSLVKKMRKVPKVCSETFPTRYRCYVPMDLVREVDEYLEKIES